MTSLDFGPFNWLVFWTCIGYFIIMFMPMPQSKPAAFFQLLIAGPLGWGLFIVFSIRHFQDKRRKL